MVISYLLTAFSYLSSLSFLLLDWFQIYLIVRQDVPSFQSRQVDSSRKLLKLIDPFFFIDYLFVQLICDSFHIAIFLRCGSCFSF